ncbi:cytoskeletal anchoring protein [Aureococcus anophagefferens]|uniref:Cytoskeletal anchoring protein n=1 Tax=Aureococcus anophagefferens TaxID=44056 RepID=A0ABR1FTJ2_AURAN
MLSNPAGREAQLKAQVRQSWAVCGILLVVLCGRELSGSGRTCSLSEADLERGEALVKSEVAWLQQHTARASEEADETLAALAEELAQVEALSNSLAVETAAAATATATAKTAQAEAVAQRDETLAALELSLKAPAKSAEAASKARLAEAQAALAASTAQAREARDLLKAAPGAQLASQQLERAVAPSKGDAAPAAAAKDAARSSSGAGCTAAAVERAVDTAVAVFFEADRVAKFDYALRATGASVVQGLTSEPYTPPGSVVPTKVWHALGRDAGVGRAEDAISQRVGFGSCFAFEGSRGSLTVQLSSRVVPTAFTLEHIHGALCNPLHNANCSSAPRTFTVLGRRAGAPDATPVDLGSFEYDAADAAKTVQTFAALNDDRQAFDLATLQVTSNYGHPDYTCVYRFRVHGDAPETV